MAIRFRRWLRIGSFVLALFVGLLVVAIVTTQTAWFRDWLRRYVIREADGYLNGDAGDPAARRQPVHRDRDRRRVADAGPPDHLRGQGRRPELQRVGPDLRRRRDRRDPHQRAAPGLEPRAVRMERRRPREGAGAGSRPRRPGQADHHQPHRHLERHRHDRRSRGAGAPRPAEAPRPPGSPGIVRLSAGRLRHRPRPCLVPRQRARARAEQPDRPGRREPGRRDRRAARHPDGGERALGARGGARRTSPRRPSISRCRRRS